MTIKELQESTTYLKEKGFKNPEAGIILGTGLGKLVDIIENPIEVPYKDIPFFPLATVESHSGKLIFGSFNGKKVLVMQGRLHLYEGYDMMSTTYPIRVMHKLGIKNLLISNAAGAINLNYKKGNLMLLEDHINLQGGSPLAFKDVSVFGERFVDMSMPYDAMMNKLLEKNAKNLGITLHKGVYASVLGPQLETRAEYKYLKIIGADAVGMSTVPEVIVANHLNLPVAAISLLTDECNPQDLKPINIPEIMAIAEKTEPKIIALFSALMTDITA